MTDGSQRAERVELFFAPSSIAIIGASADRRKWGWMAAEQALRNADRRHVWLVNSKGGEILGQASYRNAAALPAAPDLAIVTVPPAAFESTMDELLARGARAIVAITAGFGEAGPEGVAIERRVAAKVRAAGAVLVGPNCMGVFDGHAPFRCMPWAEIDTGPVGFVSQSGGLIMDLSLRLADARLGLSRAVSMGNQADVDVVDLVRNLGNHRATEVIAIYCESLRGGRALFQEIERIVRAGKPVAVLSPDSTRAAARAALSHTASLVSDRRVVRAATEAAGAIYANSLAELAEAIQALASGQRSRGRRVAVVTDTGGPGVLLAGSIERAGLSVPILSASLQAALAQLLTPRAVTANPIDLVDNLDVDPAVPVLEALCASAEVDAVLMNLHAFVHDTPEQEADAGRRLAAAVRSHGKPVVISARNLRAPGVAALADARIPVFRDGDVAARALALLCRDHAPYGVPESTASVAVAASTGARERVFSGYAEARSLAARAGIDIAPGRIVHDRAEVLEAARELGYPVVLKRLDGTHKSARDGVALNVRDEESLAATWERMSAHGHARDWSVEKMLDRGAGLELILGVRRDPRFGLVLVIGFGGVQVETIDDVIVALAPLARDALPRVLGGLRGHERLAHARADLDAVYRMLLYLTRIGATLPDDSEFELNPVLVTASGAVALDARLATV